ncbi:MAG: RHS repeat-associated core domain-containing protein, partial [Candidatus Kapabacteria bacterium]|nr:RHS repeat-associated core domain-containing protein [Candidatus Kapabacteria bacterium]
SEGMNSAEFIYGTDNERRLMTTTRSGAVTKRFYCGSYEKEVNVATGNVKEIHYLTAPTGLFAVYIKETNQPNKLYYVLTDRQGSIVGLEEVQGNSTTTDAGRFSYDAWGRMREPSDWTNYNVSVSNIIPRGYTSHEHLTDFALINMNGRLYDPALGRFLSTDNYVQSPGNPQNYNRYSYCLNNPLKYTDPSGQCFGIDDILVAMLISAAVNAYSQYKSTGKVDWQDVCIAGMKGGMLCMMTGGISAAIQVAGAAPGFIAGAASGIVINGISNCVLENKYFFYNWGTAGVIGGIQGAFKGYGIAKAKGLNPLNGNEIPKTVRLDGVTEGERQLRDDWCTPASAKTIAKIYGVPDNGLSQEELFNMARGINGEGVTEDQIIYEACGINIKDTEKDINTITSEIEQGRPVVGSINSGVQHPTIIIQPDGTSNVQLTPIRHAVTIVGVETYSYGYKLLILNPGLNGIQTIDYTQLLKIQTTSINKCWIIP